MPRHSLLPFALLALAACSSEADVQDKPAGATATATASASASAGASSQVEAVTFRSDEKLEGGERTFTWSWPAAVSAIPRLQAQFVKERDATLADEKAKWRGDLAVAPADCTSCRQRSLAKEWKVVASMPDWLSLSAEFSDYTGGAHGMYGMESLVWDRRGERSMDGVELFRSAQALTDALTPALCDALNTEREKRRGEPVDPARSNFGFDECQGAGDATVLVGSSNGKTFDRLTLWFGPYVAGPYAEGAYELDFPVTQSVIDAVKPQYKGAFSVKG